jgi:hypothetical protein
MEDEGANGQLAEVRREVITELPIGPQNGHSRGAKCFYCKCHMSVPPRREVLLKMLANFDQQMADAAALMGVLKEGSPDYDAASAWLAESTAESARVSKLLAATDE